MKTDTLIEMLARQAGGDPGGQVGAGAVGLADGLVRPDRGWRGGVPAAGSEEPGAGVEHRGGGDLAGAEQEHDGHAGAVVAFGVAALDAPPAEGVDPVGVLAADGEAVGDVVPPLGVHVVPLGGAEDLNVAGGGRVGGAEPVNEPAVGEAGQGLGGGASRTHSGHRPNPRRARGGHANG